MIIKTNETLIKRNRKIAQACSIGGLTILIAGMFVSFRMPDKIAIAMGALIIGFVLSQIGIYFTNRWGRNPRPDEILNQALKGLDNKYHLFHYTTPVGHFLVGPAGLWILSTRHQRGTITFSNSRWHQKGGNLYLKIFGQEGLGRPDLELEHDIGKMENFIKELFPEEPLPVIKAALVFTSDRVKIDVAEKDNPSAPTFHINKLKEFIRKTAKNKPVSIDQINRIQEGLFENT